MLLTPHPESSNPASTAKSGTRVRRGTYSVWLMRWLQWSSHPPETALPISCDDWPVSLSFLGGIALRFRELIIVFLSANFVSHRKRCHRSRKLLPARLPLSPVIAPLLSRPRLPAPLLLRSPGVL